MKILMMVIRFLISRPLDMVIFFLFAASYAIQSIVLGAIYTFAWVFNTSGTFRRYLKKCELENNDWALGSTESKKVDE